MLVFVRRSRCATWHDSTHSVIARKHPSATATRLVLFSVSGFDNNLHEAADDRTDLELIDIDRLDNGN